LREKLNSAAAHNAERTEAGQSGARIRSVAAVLATMTDEARESTL